jgi:hypothetical protein
MTGTIYDGTLLNFSFDSASFGKQQSTADRSEAGDYYVFETGATALLSDVNLSCVPIKCVAGWTVWIIAGKRSCVVDKFGDFSIASSNGLDSNRLLVSCTTSHNVSMDALESKASSCKINPMLNCQIIDFEPRCFIGSNEGNNPEPKSILTTKTPKQFYFNSFVSPWVAPSSSWAD